MVNRCQSPVRFVRILSDGKRSESKSQQRLVKAGETDSWLWTYESHAWVVTDEEGKAMGVYIIGDKNATIVVRDA